MSKNKEIYLSSKKHFGKFHNHNFNKTNHKYKTSKNNLNNKSLYISIFNKLKYFF